MNTAQSVLELGRRLRKKATSEFDWVLMSPLFFILTGTRRYNIQPNNIGAVISNRDVLIRVDSTHVEFPRICPVCGFEATKRRHIYRTKKDLVKDSIRTKIRYSRWFPPLPSPSTRFSLDVPVCEKHYKSPSDLQKDRSITGIVTGLAVPISIILGVFIAFNWYDRIIVPLEYYTILVFTFIALIWGLRRLGATDLDRAISIVDFVQGNPIVVIRVKARWYADEILAINPSSKIAKRKRSTPV